MKLRIDADRIVRELETLAAFSDSEPPGVTRIVFSDADRAARAWLKDLFEEAGLTVREDAVGNTFARWCGSEPGLPAVATGSHIDAIPSSGRYDGTIGVLGALEAIRSLRKAEFTPLRSVEVILFTSEEPTRFGIGCLGSRLLSGALTVENAAKLRDRNGDSLDTVRSRAGFKGDFATVRLPEKTFCAFVELHIEQGPILEREQIPIGVVTDIAAPATLRIEVKGEGGHAGAVLMPSRKDAFLAAAEIALAVEQAALATRSIDTVATAGTCQIFPGAVNSIASRTLLEIDVRDTDEARRDGVLQQIGEACRVVSARRNVSVNAAVVNADSPAQSDPKLVDVLSHAAEAAGCKHRKIVSRAYHDSLFMARIAPVAMLFIPCRNGVSHRPEEYSSPNQISAGVDVLARALRHLAAQ